MEPNYTDHEAESGAEQIACDQHPDHDVQQGEVFIAQVYNAIRQNPDLWKSTALLICLRRAWRDLRSCAAACLRTRWL